MSRKTYETRPAENDLARFATPYSIASVEGDYLIVNPFNRDGTINTHRTRYVLKPWTLQKTPFDTKTVNGVTYAYSSNTQRTATVGSTVETQLITQDYFAGAKILAILITPKAKLVGGAGDSRYTALIDINVDARAWAVQ